MTSKWEHLPNAAHIDRVLDSLENHSDLWTMPIAHSTSFSAAYTVAWRDAYDATYGAERVDAYITAANASWNRCLSGIRFVAVRDTILVLIAYDDSAHLLDSTPEEIRLLDALGHPYAIPMMPSAAVFSNMKS